MTDLINFCIFDRKVTHLIDKINDVEDSDGKNVITTKEYPKSNSISSSSSKDNDNNNSKEDIIKLLLDDYEASYNFH